MDISNLESFKIATELMEQGVKSSSDVYKIATGKYSMKRRLWWYVIKTVIILASLGIVALVIL